MREIETEVFSSEHSFYEAAHKYPEIFVIVSPPRGGSTSFARVFWEHGTVGFYAHEPFEIVYFEHKSLKEVIKKIENPLDVRDLKKSIDMIQPNNALIIKEMPYQVGKYFPLLADIATKPLIFLLRDPRLAIASRMRKKEEVGANPIYPLIETGWELIYSEIYHCKANRIPYMVVESDDFRNYPTKIFSRAFGKLGIHFSEEMLHWKSLPNVDIDNLHGTHSHLYKRVLLSQGIEPATEQIPPIESFSKENGLQEHIIECLKIYEELKKDPNRIT